MLCTVRIAPAYMDNIYIKEALKTLVQNNADVGSMANSEINEHLWKFMSVNGVKGVEANSFKIKRHQGKVLINNVYEVRKNIIYNIDVVMTFKNQLDSTNPGDCCTYLVEDVDEK